MHANPGNDSDGEEKPVVPVKTVDKATARTTKRNVEPEAPQAPARATGANRRGGLRGNDAGEWTGGAKRATPTAKLY